MKPCTQTSVYATSVLQQEKQVAATKENKGKDGSGVTTGQQDVSSGVQMLPGR